jgi:hypothetical protein
MLFDVQTMKSVGIQGRKDSGPQSEITNEKKIRMDCNDVRQTSKENTA